MSPSTMVVDAAAGSARAVRAMQAVAPNAISSALAPTSSLAWLISRTRSEKVQRPDARRRSGATIWAPRQTPSRSSGISGGASAIMGIGVQLGLGARSRCPTCRCSGRRPVNSRSRIAEPGPRGSSNEAWPPRGPAVLLSTIISSCAEIGSDEIAVISNGSPWSSPAQDW
jgi:hypothetical protein